MDVLPSRAVVDKTDAKAIHPSIDRTSHNETKIDGRTYLDEPPHIAGGKLAQGPADLLAPEGDLQVGDLLFGVVWVVLLGR